MLFVVAFIELLALLLAALLNRALADRSIPYRRFELAGLAVLWYVVLVAGAAVMGALS